MSESRAHWIETTFPRTVEAGRLFAAIVVGGCIAATAWMFMLQELHTGSIFGATWTEHDFPDSLGHAFGAEDTARGGLYLTLVLWVVVAAIYVAGERRLPGTGRVKGLVFSVAIFLAWGLIFTNVVDSRQVRLDNGDLVYHPSGFFAWSAGHRTILLGAVASIVAGLLLARITTMMRGASWWREHPTVHGLDVEAAAELLELAEERPEEGVKRAG